MDIVSVTSIPSSVACLTLSIPGTGGGILRFLAAGRWQITDRLAIKEYYWHFQPVDNVQADWSWHGIHCRLTVSRLNWTQSSWCNCRPAMFLIAPLHCFYLLLFGFLLSTTTVLTTSMAHTCTYTVVQYCSITELAPLLDEDEADWNPNICHGSHSPCWAGP